MEVKNTLLNIQWGKKKKLKREVGKYFEYFEINENSDKTYQNLSNAAKAVFRESFIAVNSYF